MYELYDSVYIGLFENSKFESRSDKEPQERIYHMPNEFIMSIGQMIAVILVDSSTNTMGKRTPLPDTSTIMP